MDEKDRHDPFATAILGFLVPGGGHFYGGRRPKAVFFFVLVTGTFLAGLLLSDFRAVSLHEQAYWFLGQVFAGAPALLAAVLSPDWREIVRGPGLEAGTLYTTVAGLLNVLVILDAVFPAGFQLLFNVDEKEAPENPRELYAILRGPERRFALLAGFSSMTVALGAVRSLSFITDKGDTLSLPRDIVGGVFRSAPGAVVVLGGGLTEEQRSETETEIGKDARWITVGPEAGDERTRKKSWWKR